MLALSFSNTTGRISNVNEEANIHNALRVKLKANFVPLHEKSVAVEVAFLNVSGNISVNPHSLSASVSSTNSCKSISKVTSDYEL